MHQRLLDASATTAGWPEGGATASEGEMISWMLGRGQFARQSFLSLNQGRAKHVDACDEGR